MSSSDQHEYTRHELEELLVPCVNKTLGEIDTSDVFFAVDPARNTNYKPKVKGIIGDVMEQSVLGYPANSDQAPDLIVDGREVEFKTTGLRASKNDDGWEAKEPMSITAVSIKTIAGEEFETSNFWHKARRMLIVYYNYETGKVELSIEYSRFHVLGYQFHSFDADEVETLKNDWELVRDFIEEAQATLTGEELEHRYSQLGSALRGKLMLIDTSPKHPNPPRFRLKRAAVTVMARKKFGDTRYVPLSRAYTTMDAIDNELRQRTWTLKGRSLAQIGATYGVTPGSKNFAEQLFVRLFGAKGKINSIELFEKAGIKVKTANLLKGKPAEDTKFYTVDFDEFSDGSLTFEDSEMFRYFSESQFIFMVTEEPRAHASADEKIFLGFKRLALPDEVIYGEVRSCFESTRDLIANGKLRFVTEIDPATGQPRMNKSGTVKGAPNFPKSSDCQVFIKGTGTDARSRTEVVPGVPMYKQQVWWGKDLTGRLLDATPWVR